MSSKFEILESMTDEQRKIYLAGLSTNEKWECVEYLSKKLTEAANNFIEASYDGMDARLETDGSKEIADDLIAKIRQK